MNYPLISEYVEAIKAAEDNFEQLKHLHPVLDDDGQPVMSSGNFAVVFKMKDEKTGKLYAVKCFLRDQEGRAQAYRQIAEELEYVSSTFLTPIKYLDKELFVDTKAIHGTQTRLKGDADQNLRSQYPSIEGGAFFTIDCIRNYELIRELWSYGKDLLVLNSDDNIQEKIFETICEMKEEYSKVIAK